MTATLDEPVTTVRRGRGRPRGSTNRAARELNTAVRSYMDATGCTLIDALTSVYEDPGVSVAVRLAALRHLWGSLASRAIRQDGPGGQTA